MNLTTSLSTHVTREYYGTVGDDLTISRTASSPCRLSREGRDPIPRVGTVAPGGGTGNKPRH